MLEKLTRATPPMLDKRGQGGQSKSVRAEPCPRCPAEPPGGRSYLRATANSLDRVKRSLLLLGNMAARMSVNRPEGAKTEIRHAVR